MTANGIVIRLILCMGLLTVNGPVGAEDSPVDAGPTMLAQVPRVPETPSLPAITPAAGGMQGKISLDLRNIDIVDALKFVAIKAGINIITSKTVSGRVTLMVNSAPIQDVFDLMLRSNNLAYDRQGDLYSVMPQEEYRSLYGKNFSDVRVVKVFALKYIVPAQAQIMLDLFKSEVGKFAIEPETGNVLVMDTPERIAMIEQVLKDYEKKNAIKAIKLNYARAKDIEESLKGQLDAKSVGTIKASERDNQVIVQALPERMAQIEELVRDLDQKTKEIIIDINIVQVNLSNVVDTGISWEGLFDVARSHGLTYLGSVPFSTVQSESADWISRKAQLANVSYVGSYPSSSYTTNYSSGSASTGLEEMHFGVIGKHDVDFIMKFLQTKGNTKIMSNPKITVVNNQEASIHVGSRLAYVTTTTTAGTSTANTISEQVQYIDTGVILHVTPDINEENFISLKVKAEVNESTKTYRTPTENEIPIVDTSKAETTVMVKEGTTVIIGGLRKETTVKEARQTPLLGSIPFLGHLFKSTHDVKQKYELIIIMTPRITSGEALVSGENFKPGDTIPLKPMKAYLGEQLPQESDVKQVYLPPPAEKIEMKGLRK